VVGADDESAVLAAAAAAALGLRHNPVGAVRATRNKVTMRRRFARAGLNAPRCRQVALDESPRRIAGEVPYPCVLKPLGLSASRGVIRADDEVSFVSGFERILAILSRPDVRRSGVPRHALLVEDFVSGPEFALEGLLENGSLRLLALFDKPDPLDGPLFEETIYVTPSRLGQAERDALVREAAAGCRALGLREGPVHAELRLHGGEPWLIEIAARTIGGLCSRTLRFGAGVSLEELVLRHALGLGVEDAERREEGAGVMMIPVPRAGVLREVHGLARARAVPLVEDVELTVHRGTELVPLPEGHAYVGFIFARGPGPAGVERALREAHRSLDFVVD
jgi:biotin carboxylase